MAKVKKITLSARSKKKPVFLKVGKKITIRGSHYRKIFFSIVSLMKRYFIFFTEKSDDERVSSRPILHGYPKFKKSITKSRGFFYYPVKKKEKYFKSKKNLRLFKKFVRKYNYKVRAPINFKKLMGYAQFYFRVVGCKKRFKQRIFIRSAIKKFYKIADNKKMYTRWKKIKLNRSKWLGFYGNFEGRLIRAVKWAGLANSKELIKFLIKSGLIFVNGALNSNERYVMKGGDILSVRKDINKFLEKKKIIYLTKKHISRFPFYNETLKNKLIKRSSRIARGLMRKSYKTASLTKSQILLNTNILESAGVDPVTRNYALNTYKNLKMGAAYKWHKYLKRVSAFKYKEGINSNKLFNADSNLTGSSGRENFLFKKNNTVMLHSKPLSVDNFFSYTLVKKKKIYNPNVLRYFYERNYKY